MNTEKRKLAINVGARLINASQMTKRNLENELERTYGVLINGMQMGEVSITPEELKEVLSEEVFAKILEDAERLRVFVNSL